MILLDYGALPAAAGFNARKANVSPRLPVNYYPVQIIMNFGAIMAGSSAFATP